MQGAPIALGDDVFVPLCVRRHRRPKDRLFIGKRFYQNEFCQVNWFPALVNGFLDTFKTHRLFESLNSRFERNQENNICVCAGTDDQNIA